MYLTWTSAATMSSGRRPPHHDWYELTHRNPLAVRPNHDIAIRSCGSGDISRALPRNEVNSRIAKLSRKNCRKKARQARLHADFGFQLPMEERQFAWQHPR